jgi:hypothetical protein
VAPLVVEVVEVVEVTVDEAGENVFGEAVFFFNCFRVT